MSLGGGSGLPGMTRITGDISVSLDGFVTGPDPSPDSGRGTGEALHTWAFPDGPDDRGIRARWCSERDLDIDRDAPDLRRLPVIR
jgi:hypothetical protein